MINLLLALAGVVALATSAFADVVSIGLQLPTDDVVRCVTGYHYFHIARVAARFIETSDWWVQKTGGMPLRLELLPSADSYQSWQSSVKYALEPEPKCGKDCRVFRAGIVGPFDLQGTQLVSLVTRMAGMLHVPYSAVDESLTIDATSQMALDAQTGALTLPPFFRASHTDTMEIGALYSFIQASGWRIFTVVHTREQHSADSAVLLSDVAQHSTLNPKANVWASISYDPMDPQSITRALTSIEADVSRVIVLLASSKDAAPFLMRAHDAGMTGKGYTWVGTEWVREFTWVAASMPEYLLNTGVGSTNETIVEAPMETGGEGADRRRRLSSKMTGLDSIMAAAAKLPVGSDGKAAETMKRLAEEAASKANSKHIRGEGQTTAASTSASRNLAAQSTWWGLNPNVGAKAIPTGAGKVLAAMNGAVGVVPRRILQNEALAGYLDRFSPDLVDDTAYMTVSSLSPPVDTSNGATVFAPLPFPTEKDCYLMNNAPATTSGLPLDHWGPYVFDAVFSIAQITAEALSPTTINSRAADISAERVAAAKARAVVAGLNGTAVIAAGNAAAFSPLAGVKMSQLNGTYLASLMRSYSQYLRPSMLTNNVPVWMPNGDRYNITLHLVNVQGEKIVPISTWTPKVRPRNVLMGEAGKGSLPAGLAMTDGNWTVMSASSKIIWPGQIVGFPPPDRVVESSHAGSIALAIALVGIIISFLLGSVVHHAGITILPESGVTVLVGCVFGLLLRLGFGTAVQNVAGFNETAFMLILLPIIIFESGYSLDKRPFFSQVFSIAIFAIAGTTISALAIGGLLRWAGWGGVIESLSIEEAMSFASLLSATDPVATLAVFQSLKVHPTLYALVYGESVVNDAVAIVLYRTFTSFLVNEITTNAAVYAILSFFGVLFLSVIIGVIFGAIATLSFRYVNVTGQERHVRWERELHAQVDKFKRFIPKMPSLHVDDEEEMAAIESAYQEEKKAEEAAQAAEEQAAETNVAIASSTSFHGAGAGTTTLSKRNVTIKDDSKAVVARMNVPDDADDGAKTMASVDLMSGIAESAILLLFGYVSFAFAESIYLSGIVASLFCGISMSLYTRRILTRDGKVISSAIFKMLANIAETVVFFQIGLTVILTLNIEAFDFGFVTFTLFACLLARALNIFPLSYLLNQYRDDPLPPSFQLALWYSGLRGAIAFVTALGFPTQHRDLIVNTASWICLFTIFFLGGSTTTALDTLHIPYNVDSDKYYKDKAARDRAIRKAHARALKARMAALSAANTPVAAVEAAKIAKQAEDEDPEAAKLNAADAPVGIELKMSMERRSKEMMRWIDRAIQKVVYGRVFLREMELANAISTLKARRSVLQSLGLPFPANLQKQLEDKERRLQEGDKGKWYDADDDDDDDVFGDDADAFEDDSDDEDSNNNGQSSPRKKKRNQDGSENQLERDRKKKSAHALKNPTRAAARDPMHFMKKYDSADRAALAKVYQVQAEIVAEEEKAKGKKTTVVIPTASPLAEDDPAAAADVGLFGSHHTASATAATTVSNPSPAPPSSTTSSSCASSAAGTGLALSKAVDEWDAAVNAATITQPPPGIVRSPSPAVPASASASAAPAPAPAPAPAAAPIATVSGNIFGLSDDHAAFIASWGSKLETSSAALTTPSGKSGRNADSATAPVVAEPALAAAVVEIPGWNAPAIAFAAPAPVPSPVPAAAKKPSPVPERASPAPVHPGRGVTLKTTPTTATASAASSFTPDQQPANASASSGPLFTTGATPWRGSGPTPVASPEPVATHQAAPAAAQSQTPAPVHVTPAARTLAANPLFSSPNLPASPAHSVGSVGGSLFLGSPGSTAAASGATGEWSHASGTATGAHNQVPPPPTSSMSSSVSAPASPLLAAARTAAQAVVSSVSGASEDHSAVGNNSGSSGSGAGADDDGEGSGIGSADHSVRASPTAGLLAAAAAATAPSGNVSSGNASRTSFVSAKGGPPTRRPTAAPGAHPPHLPASITSSINDHHHHDDGEDFASLPDAFHYDEDEQTADTSAHSGVAGTGAAASRAGSNNRGSIVGGAGRAGSNSRASFIHGPGSGASVGAGAGAGGSRSGSALRRPSHQTMLPAPPADSGIGFETEAAPGTSSGTASKPDDPFAF